MPKMPKIEVEAGQKWHLREDALEKWQPSVKAATDNATISILDVIGEDIFGDGITAKRVAGALRAIGDQDICVDINSPGGDFFEGVAIYNLLRAHPGQVTVRVLGLAASAASVIAMAADDLQIGRAGFLMIHNAWTIAIGDRHDMADLAATMESFDRSMASVYSARSSLLESDIASMMDSETWLSGKEAVDQGFADGFLPDDLIVDEPQAKSGRKALAKVENALQVANPNSTRSERRALLTDAKIVTPSAGETDTPSAVGENDVLLDILSVIKAHAA